MLPTFLQVLLLTFMNVFSFADGYLLLSGCTVEQPSPGCLRRGSCTESTEKGSVKGISLPPTCTVLSVVLYRDCRLTEESFL